MKLLQISDPHFGTERPAVVQGLLTLAAELAPDLVLLSGDITQRATVAQFTAARAFTDALTTRGGGKPIPLLAIPGNHDLPLLNVLARALWPYARYRAAFGPALERQWDSPQLQLTALDSTRRWRHEDGTLSAAQIERVAQRLGQATPDQLRVVVTHHPLAVQRVQDRPNLLHGHAAALQAWARAGADVLLGGHIHLPYVLGVHLRQPQERPQERPPQQPQQQPQQQLTPPRPMWVVQAGTAVSSRVRHEAGNSVNVLHIDGGTAPGARRCRVERWDWRDGAQRFVSASLQALACGAADGRG